jgi:hypothetical protein
VGTRRTAGILAALGAGAFAVGCPSLAGFTGGARPGPDATDESTDDSSGDDVSDAGPLDSPFTVVQAPDAGETITAVYAADSQHAYAVGTNGLHYDLVGGKWIRSQAVLGRDYYGIWGQSALDVYCVGVDRNANPPTGVVQSRDAVGWHDEYLPPTPVYGVWGTGPPASQYVIAVGTAGNVYSKHVGVLPWGTFFGTPLEPNTSVPTTPDSPVLLSVSGVDVGDFYIAAGRDTLYVTQESTSSVYLLSPGVDTSISFQKVWQAPVAKPSAFFGTNYFGIAWLTGATIDASTFTDADPTGEGIHLYTVAMDQSQPDNDKLFIRGIWGDSAEALFVGDQGRLYSFSPGDQNAARIPSPTGAALWGVSGSGADDVWIVGEHETILHGSLPH